MSDGVWAVAESEAEGLHEVSLEILGEGRRLADSLRTELAAILVGWKKAHLAETLFQYGADRVYLAEHLALSDYTTEGYCQVLTGLIQTYSPQVVLTGATPNGCDLAPRVAARLNIELVTNCTSVKARRGGFEVNRPICEGKVYRSILCLSPPPLMFSLCPGMLGKDKPDKSRRGELVEVKPELDLERIRTRVSGFVKADARTLDLGEADVVVVGGSGVGDAESWNLIDELAELLGGCAGGTRMAMDAGWIARERLVGQTGRSIGPKLCLEIGVSGAIQHTAGIRDSKYTIAVNKDRNAPIFKVADTGVVADLHELVPALIRRIRELKGSVEV